MPMEIDSKLPEVGVTIFTVMSKLANDHGAINLSQGFPDYKIDWNAVKDHLSPKTRLMILNSPHNPSGSVLLEDDMQALKHILNSADVLILSDEVYEHIIFDDVIHESISRHPELASRSFVVSSFGKTYHTTGWKIGYCLSDEPDVAFSRRITIDHGVASIPVSAFYHDHTDHRVVRFCFAKKNETLERAAEKLCRI